jgi:hypothetical protein
MDTKAGVLHGILILNLSCIHMDTKVDVLRGILVLNLPRIHMDTGGYA